MTWIYIHIKYLFLNEVFCLIFQQKLIKLIKLFRFIVSKSRILYQLVVLVYSAFYFTTFQIHLLKILTIRLGLQSLIHKLVYLII